MTKEFVKRSKFRSMASWIIHASNHGIDMRKFHSDKLEDNQRLEESGLPVWNKFKVPYREFHKNNPQLMEFFSKYEQFLIRAIPNTSELNRFSNLGVSDFKECLDFLRKGVNPKHADSYSVLMTEWEPTEYGGIIISRPNSRIIEISKELDELEHGQVTPVTGYSNGLGMKYTTEDTELRQLMWNSLKYVKGLEGYFEFVITEKDRSIKFIDYKTSRGYLE